jgi:hypothetical protein
MPSEPCRAAKICAGDEAVLQLPKNRMSELFTSGSVGRAAGNRCPYPATINAVDLNQQATIDGDVLTSRVAIGIK